MPPPLAGCTAPAPSMGPRSQVIVMGMSRSGTSLTTSIIAALLRQGGDIDSSWRGSADAYPTDRRNRNGYFERADAVALNYKYVYDLTGSVWTHFPDDYAAHPHLLNFSAPGLASKRVAFQSRAASIVSDMEKHAPWVLKDVRFARTLPLWWPLLREPVCIIPYRHPLEVAASSLLHSVALWENYMTAALTSTRAMGCPTMLVSYADWLEPTAAKAQLESLYGFLRCAHVQIGEQRQAAPTEVLDRLVRPHEHHSTVESARKISVLSRQLTPHAACMWEQLKTGEALTVARGSCFDNATHAS
mmetsp:Transcript_10886/g.35070  ORF Transcript_10886/g.35070 Transcript_10886/m.35070 type:complete len:302 (-) Transcript_10886:384-1289(-)